MKPKRTHYGYSSAYSGPYGGAYDGTPVGWTPANLGLRAWYDAEAGQPKGVGYVQLDGSSGDYVYTPVSNNLLIAGDIEVVMRVKANDWTAAANQTLVGRYVTTGNQRSWRFYVSTTGAVVLTASADGTVVTSASITPTVALTDNAWVWLRMRLQLTNGANSVATLDIAADQAEEPTSWTANGSQTAAIIASVFGGTAPLEIGTFGQGTLERFTGQVSRCIVRDGFGGPAVADFDARLCNGNGYIQPYTTGGVGSSKYTQLYGRNSDFISCADANPLDITGDIDVIARAPIQSLAPATSRVFVAKGNNSGSQYSWTFEQYQTNLYFIWTTGGTSASQQFVNLNITGILNPGQTYWLRATLVAATGVATLYWAPDAEAVPSSWTQLTTKTVGATSIFSGTAPLSVGGLGLGSSLATGGFRRAIVRNGIDGTVVADYNAQLADVDGQRDSYGNTWLHNNLKLTRWYVGLPKIYDRSGNGVAPATFGAGSNMPQWYVWDGTAEAYLPSVANNSLTATVTQGTINTSLQFVYCIDDMTVSGSFGAIGWNAGPPGSGAVSGMMVYHGVTGLPRVFFGSGGVPQDSGNIGGAPPAFVRWWRVTWTFSTGVVLVERAQSLTNDPSQVVWVTHGSYSGVAAGSYTSGADAVAVGEVPYAPGNFPMGGGFRRFIVIADGSTTKIDLHAASLAQSGGTDSTGNTWTVNRSTTGRKLVVQSAVAGSARSVISHGTDDWIDVPAAAVPALDTFAAASSVSTSFRRWHNPGTQGHPIFTTKASVGNTVLGMAIRMPTSAGSNDINVWAGDGVGSDGTVAGAQEVDFGLRGVATASLGNASPFIDSRVNATSDVDTARSTTTTTSTAGAGRIGAFTAGAGPIDMEFDALICRDVATTDTEHGQLTAYYKGGL